jgi:hypothetical protein
MGRNGKTLHDSGRWLGDYAANLRFGNRAHIGVFRRAFLHGFMRYPTKCPYEDRTQGRGKKPTYSRGYIKAWTQGYQAGQRAREIYDQGKSGG